MRRAFHSYDKDGNGVLDANEVLDLLTNHFREQGIKKKPSVEDIQDFFKDLDDDHSGEIEFEEFKEFLVRTMHKNLMAPLKEYLILKGINLVNEDEKQYWATFLTTIRENIFILHIFNQ